MKATSDQSVIRTITFFFPSLSLSLEALELHKRSVVRSVHGESPAEYRSRLPFSFLSIFIGGIEVDHKTMTVYETYKVMKNDDENCISMKFPI